MSYSVSRGEEGQKDRGGKGRNFYCGKVGGGKHVNDPAKCAEHFGSFGRIGL